MSIAKVVEIWADSSDSFEDAVERGIQQAGKTLRNIRGAWIQEQKVDVKDGRIVQYRVNLKLTFVLD
ncbi:MAG: dodecin family protein [Gammaproteobacteria bacterium]